MIIACLILTQNFDDPKVVELLEQVSNEEYDPEIIHIVNYKGSNFLVQLAMRQK